MKHNPSETSAYTPGTPALPQPIPQEVIPTCKKIDRKYFYQTFFLNVKKSTNSILKSDNLQYNTPGRWVDGPNDSSTKRLMFQVLFFL